MENLDNQAEIFDLEEKQHFTDARFTDPTIARNAYLNHWNLTYHAPWRKERRARM